MQNQIEKNMASCMDNGVYKGNNAQGFEKQWDPFLGVPIMKGSHTLAPILGSFHFWKTTTGPRPEQGRCIFSYSDCSSRASGLHMVSLNGSLQTLLRGWQIHVLRSLL